MLAEKQIYCKKCHTTHLLMDVCASLPNKHVDSTPKNNGNGPFENGAEWPKSTTFSPAAPLNQLQSHSSDVDNQKVLVEWFSQMEGSLKTPKDKRRLNETNYIDLEAFQVGLSDQ